jgi:hypothetical protein
MLARAANGDVRLHGMSLKESRMGDYTECRFRPIKSSICSIYVLPCELTVPSPCSH